MSATVHDCYELSENVSSNTLEGGVDGLPVNGYGTGNRLVGDG
jgi:hypothetical protein